MFNIDGLPIYKSSAVEFWPILCKIYKNRNIKPFVIAMYCGKGKPPLEPFLKEFIEELNKLLTSGIMVNETFSKIKIKCIVCDTPARNYILGKICFIHRNY